MTERRPRDEGLPPEGLERERSREAVDTARNDRAADEQEAVELPDREAMTLLHGPGSGPPPAIQADSAMGTLPVEPRDGT